MNGNRNWIGKELEWKWELESSADTFRELPKMKKKNGNRKYGNRNGNGKELEFKWELERNADGDKNVKRYANRIRNEIGNVNES